MNKKITCIVCILFPYLLYAQNSDSLLATFQNLSLDLELRYEAMKEYLLNHESSDNSLIYATDFLEVVQSSNFSDQWLGKALAIHSIISSRNYKIDQAIEYGEQAVNYREFLEKKILIDLYWTLAESYGKKQNYLPRIKYLKEIITLISKEKDYLQLARVFNELGGTYLGMSMYSDALDSYYEAEYFFSQLDSNVQQQNLRLLWLIGGNISVVHSSIGDFERSYQQALKNLEIVKKMDNASDLAGTYSVMAKAEIELGQEETGLERLKEVMKIRREAGIPAWTCNSANAIGYYYLEKKNYQEAKRYYEEALSNALKMNDKAFSHGMNPTSFQVRCYLNLGNLNVDTKKFQPAVTYCAEAWRIHSTTSDLLVEAQICECLAKSYEGLSQLDSALFYQKKYTHFEREHLNRIDIQNVKELSVKSDFEKIMLQDSLNFARERFGLELDSARQKTQRNWILVIAFFLLGSSFLWFLRRRWKFQAALQAKQAEAQRLRELDSFKTKLYTNLTHEFRTPLTVILGMAKNILNAPQQKFKEEAQLIKRNGQNLLRLVNQLLDLSKLENKSFQLNQVQEDIISYLRYVSESFQSHANGQNLSLRFFTTTKELVMDFDPEQLKQVMTNLISNAIKFTPSEGEIKIEVTQKGEHLIIEVSDTGIGISKNNLPHIFDRFYQVDGSTTRAGEGTGIGLAHTQELVKLMKGKIEVESELGQGTHFWIYLPVIKNEGGKRKEEKRLAESAAINYFEQTQTVSNPIEGSSRHSTLKSSQTKLLLIEDNPDVVTYLKTCLDNQYEILIAYNGRIGIELALEYIPDLIISDVMMPEKDGYEVCDALKNDERTSHIPIVLLTAKADANSKIMGLKKGADAYLFKPFDKEELLVRLKQLSLLRQRLKEKYVSLSVTNFQVPKETSNPEDIFFQKLLQIIEDNYTDDRFSLAELCQKVGMSRSQLFRKMKALVDVSPSVFLRDFRLEKAKQLLETASVSVSEAAYQTGFKDPSYFSKLFKQKFGMQPNYLRK